MISVVPFCLIVGFFGKRGGLPSGTSGLSSSKFKLIVAYPSPCLFLATILYSPLSCPQTSTMVSEANWLCLSDINVYLCLESSFSFFPLWNHSMEGLGSATSRQSKVICEQSSDCFITGFSVKVGFAPSMGSGASSSGEGGGHRSVGRLSSPFGRTHRQS